MEEILEYRKTHTVMETADWLGLTRQTYSPPGMTREPEQLLRTFTRKTDPERLGISF